MYASVSHFHPSLIFVDKSKNYPYRAVLWGTDSDEHSSLVRYIINNDRKKFGTATLSIMTSSIIIVNIMKLSIMTSSIKALSITTSSIRTFSILTLIITINEMWHAEHCYAECYLFWSSIMTLSKMTFSIMAINLRHSAEWQSVVMLSAECHICWESFMLSVAYKIYMLSIVMPSIIMLSVMVLFMIIINYVPY